MTVAILIDEELVSEQLTDRLSNLRLALERQVANPADPSQQQQISEIISALRQLLPNATSNSWAIPERAIVETLGFDNLLGNALLEQIEDVVARNAITPSVVLEVVSPLDGELSQRATNLKELIKTLSYFDLGPSRLERVCEVSITIPRGEVDDSLDPLGEEFQKLARIIGPFQELAIGSRPQIEVREIASSDFEVYVAAIYLVGLAILKAIQTVADTFNSIVTLRATRQQLALDAVPADVLAALDEHIESVMDKRIISYVEEIMSDEGDGANVPAGRKNELGTELRIALNAIANRMSKGYEFDVRIPEQDEETSEPRAATRQLRALRLSRSGRFWKMQDREHFPQREVLP